MMRVIVLLALVGASEAALRSAPTKPATKTAPLVAKKADEHVKLSAEKTKAMHWGCVNACKPSPVESKCVTACEAKMYKCIDQTGPNETPKDTEKCQSDCLKLYEETKGVEKKAEKKDAKKEGAKKEEKKEEKKAKSLLQIVRDDGEDDSFADEDAAADESTEDEEVEEDSADEGSAADEDAEQSSEEDSEAGEETEEVAGEDSEAAEETEEGAAEDSEAGEDTEEDAVEDSEAGEDTEEEAGEESPVDDEEVADENVEDESFVQVSKNNDDDDNEEASDMASEDADETATGEASDDEENSEEASSESDDEEESFLQMESEWKPEPDSGVKLYEHPQGSTVVTPCPVSSHGNAESCNAYFGGKADGAKCPQISCPKALGVTMKLTCGGGCCPTCWAPDHVIAVDRHTSIDDAAVVDAAPAAPSSCGGVKCFKLGCAAGFTEGHVNGACCYSCVPGR